MCLRVARDELVLNKRREKLRRGSPVFFVCVSVCVTMYICTYGYAYVDMYSGAHQCVVLSALL